MKLFDYHIYTYILLLLFIFINNNIYKKKYRSVLLFYSATFSIDSSLEFQFIFSIVTLKIFIQNILWKTNLIQKKFSFLSVKNDELNAFK